jgi:hypothetical protein
LTSASSSKVGLYYRSEAAKPYFGARKKPDAGRISSSDLGDEDEDEDEDDDGDEDDEDEVMVRYRVFHSTMVPSEFTITQSGLHTHLHTAVQLYDPPHEIRKNFVQKIHAPFFKIDHLLLPRYKESTEKMGYVMGKTKEQFTLRVVMYRL